LKIGVVMFALLAAAAGPSAFAKRNDGHHAHHAGAARAAAHRSAPASHNNPVADRAGENSAGDKIDLGGSAMPLPSHEAGRTATSPKLQIVKPDHAPTRRFGISVPSRPPVRNAIGQPVMPAVDVKTDSLQSQTASSSQAGGRMSRQSGYGSGSIGNAKPIVGQSESAARESMSISSRGRIDGTALIRPASAASLGGPAKPAGRINGTLLRQKRR